MAFAADARVVVIAVTVVAGVDVIVAVVVVVAVGGFQLRGWRSLRLHWQPRYLCVLVCS